LCTDREAVTPTRRGDGPFNFPSWPELTKRLSDTHKRTKHEHEARPARETKGFQPLPARWVSGTLTGHATTLQTVGNPQPIVPLNTELRSFRLIRLCVKSGRFVSSGRTPLQNGAMIYGYARVSTDGQSVDAQVRQLRAAGAATVFREVASGAKTDRAQRGRLLG
jgi:Resolvase, N terminal domain